MSDILNTLTTITYTASIYAAAFMVVKGLQWVVDIEKPWQRIRKR